MTVIPFLLGPDPVNSSGIVPGNRLSDLTVPVESVRSQRTLHPHPSPRQMANLGAYSPCLSRHQPQTLWAHLLQSPGSSTLLTPALSPTLNIASPWAFLLPFPQLLFSYETEPFWLCILSVLGPLLVLSALLAIFCPPLSSLPLLLSPYPSSRGPIQSTGHAQSGPFQTPLTVPSLISIIELSPQPYLGALISSMSSR